VVVRLAARGKVFGFLCVIFERLASLRSAIYVLVVLVVLVGGDVVSLVWGLFSGCAKQKNAWSRLAKFGFR
jgi:hypothetical protein